MSRYTVYLTPRAITEIKDLPGNAKQRVKREISALADNACPSNSKALKIDDAEFELRRIRLDRWRIVYSVIENEKIMSSLL